MNNFFGEGKELIRGKKWSWDNFKTTKDFPVSENLLDWIIGQDQALKECTLCLDEWVHKLKWIEKEKWYDAWRDLNIEKPCAKKFLPAGPYLLLLGDAGTGKSLLGRALAFHLTELYKKHNVKLKDVLCWENKVIPSEPRISLINAGEGQKMVKKEKFKHEKKNILKKWLIKLSMYFMSIVAAIFISIGFIWLWYSYQDYFTSIFLQNNYSLIDWMMESFVNVGARTFLPAGMILLFMIIWIFMGRIGIMGGAKGISGSEQTEAPKLIVNNSEKIAPFIDATGHQSSQLFGSVAWDPFQTGGLGTPEHQRTTAGDVHRANLGILYIDEIKNLHQEEAVTLLTVLEEGQLPITLRNQWHGGGTSAMAISTEPIPCLTFLVGAGNFDSIEHIHPALMDRIVGYGKVVRMNNDMPNTIENRRKYVQFIAQEIKRFRLLPFTKEACIEIINESRRRSNKRDYLSTKFRPLISIIKTAGILAQNEKSKYVTEKYIIEAINEHCKTIQKQLLEHHIQEEGKFMEIEPKGNVLGQIYGLAVTTDEYSGEMTGSVLRVKAQMIKKTTKNLKGYFKVTGVAKNATWIKGSIEKVRSVILKRYNVDIAQEYFTHIDFSQAYGIDGPSAGVTMTILLCSLLEGKPIKQDIAVTGEINISSTDEIEITAVGGLHEKIKAAETWDFKKVVIPLKNYQHSIEKSDYKIIVIGCQNLDDYLKEILEKCDD